MHFVRRAQYKRCPWVVLQNVHSAQVTKQWLDSSNFSRATYLSQVAIIVSIGTSCSVPIVQTESWLHKTWKNWMQLLRGLFYPLGFSYLSSLYNHLSKKLDGEQKKTKNCIKAKTSWNCITSQLKTQTTTHLQLCRGSQTQYVECSVHLIGRYLVLVPAANACVLRPGNIDGYIFGCRELHGFLLLKISSS